MKALNAEKKSFEDLLKEAEEKLRAAFVNYNTLDHLFKSHMSTIVPDLQSQILELQNSLANCEKQQIIEDRHIAEAESEGQDSSEREDRHTAESEDLYTTDNWLKVCCIFFPSLTSIPHHTNFLRIDFKVIIDLLMQLK